MAKKESDSATRNQIVFMMFAVALTLIALVLLGYWAPWTGFDAYAPIKSGEVEIQREKTLWDWLNLLIVPAVLAAGGLWFSRSERKRDHEMAQQRARETQETEDNRLRDAALREYLDRMSELLLTHRLVESVEGTPVRYVARARTLTILATLAADGVRKGRVVQFLHESGLIGRDNSIVSLSAAGLNDVDVHATRLIGINLSRAFLSNANFTETDLSSSDLSMVQLSSAILKDAILKETDLSGAILADADLSGSFLARSKMASTTFLRSNLSHAYLKTADLTDADLKEADLTEANMTEAKLTNADLNGAKLTSVILVGADLLEAKLTGALLQDADMSRANLRGSFVSDEQLLRVKSLKGAIMPDGTVHD